MLLLCRMLTHCTVPEEAASTLNNYVSRDLFEAVKEGFDAARIAGRILNRFLVEKAVFQRYWRCM